MPGSRDGRVRGGGGGRPSRGGGGFYGGTGDRAAPSNGAAGGEGAPPLADTRGKRRQGPVRYAEEQAVRMQIEKGLRLQRLEQVRQQSRRQAAAVREEYRRRREENKRAAVRKSEVRKI